MHRFGLISALTCTLAILIGICFGRSDLDCTFYSVKLLCLQLDPCIFDTPSDKKGQLCSVSNQSVTTDASFCSGLEDMVNVVVVDPS